MMELIFGWIQMPVLFSTFDMAICEICGYALEGVLWILSGIKKKTPLLRVVSYVVFETPAALQYGLDDRTDCEAMYISGKMMIWMDGI
jgi:hypothetical protein